MFSVLDTVQRFFQDLHTLQGFRGTAQDMEWEMILTITMLRPSRL